MNPQFKPTINRIEIEGQHNILRIIAFCFLIGLFFSAISLFGCSSPPQNVVFDSVQQCASSGAYTLDECQAQFSAAQTNYQKDAPKFTAKAQCEAQFGSGNCETRHTDNGDLFLPFMVGYMMGGGFNYYPVYRGYGGGYSTYDTYNHHTTVINNKTVVVNPTNLTKATAPPSVPPVKSTIPATSTVSTGPNAATKLAPATTTTTTAAPRVSTPSVAPRTSVPSVGSRSIGGGGRK